MSFRAFSTVSFRAPFPVISSEARNLSLGEKISQSPPLTFVGERLLRNDRGGHLKLSFFVISGVAVPVIPSTSSCHFERSEKS